MIRVLFITMFAAVLFRWAKNWRRVVGVTLIATLSVGMLFPQPTYAQFGLLGGIQNRRQAKPRSGTQQNDEERQRHETEFMR